MPAQKLIARVGGVLRVLPVRVKLDGKETIVLNFVERLAQRWPIQRAFAGNEVIVLATRDILHVKVPDFSSQHRDDVGDRFADDLAVPDVEIRAEARVIEAINP